MKNSHGVKWLSASHDHSSGVWAHCKSWDTGYTALKPFGQWVCLTLEAKSQKPEGHLVLDIDLPAPS